MAAPDDVERADALWRAPSQHQAPSVTRRIACLPYEGLLLLALILIASFPFAGLKHLVLQGPVHALYQGYLLAVTAGYYVWFWTHGGQTLPMKTWRFRVVRRVDASDADGGQVSLQPLGTKQALGRYLAALVFFGPACAGILLLFFPQRISPVWTIWLFVPALATLLWAKFDADQQFLHDRIAGTRLVAID